MRPHDPPPPNPLQPPLVNLTPRGRAVAWRVYRNLAPLKPRDSNPWAYAHDLVRPAAWWCGFCVSLHPFASSCFVAPLDPPLPLAETRPLTAAQRRPWNRAQRRPGRPRPGMDARVISLRVEQTLLAHADRTARRAGISRAALFDLGLRAVLSGFKKAG